METNKVLTGNHSTLATTVTALNREVEELKAAARLMQGSHSNLATEVQELKAAVRLMKERQDKTATVLMLLIKTYLQEHEESASGNYGPGQPRVNYGPGQPRVKGSNEPVCAICGRDFTKH